MASSVRPVATTTALATTAIRTAPRSSMALIEGHGPGGGARRRISPPIGWTTSYPQDWSSGSRGAYHARAARRKVVTTRVRAGRSIVLRRKTIAYYDPGADITCQHTTGQVRRALRWWPTGRNPVAAPAASATSGSTALR